MREEEFLELIKGLLTSRGPVPAVVLFCEIKQGADYCRVVRDELIIEVGKTKEGLYILDFSGSRPSSDAVEFDWVHGELTRFYNHSKVFNFRNIKLAFLEL